MASRRRKLLPLFCLLVVAVVIVTVVYGPSSTQYLSFASTVPQPAPLAAFETKTEMEDEEGQDAERELNELLKVLKARIKNYDGPVLNLTAKPCAGQNICYDPDCPHHFSPSLKERLRQLLSVRETIPARYLRALRRAASPVKRHKYVLVTGASSNHYKEMQMALHGVHYQLLPLLQGKDYHLVVYNLGLNDMERRLTQKNCRCTVLDFPFSDLPDFVSYLTCYIWKPLIMQSLLEKAEYLMWFDASIRFRKSDPILKLFERARLHGYQTRSILGSIGVRTRPETIAYFGDHVCQYSPYGEMETNFFILYNDRFTRQAVMKPWISCAFNRTCMCPPSSSFNKRCKTDRLPKNIRPYSACHRWEQSTIGIIFSRLYLQYRPMLHVLPGAIKIERGSTMSWFRDDSESGGRG